MSIEHETLTVGDVVELIDEFDCIVPPGSYTVTHVNENGSFCVNGGRTGVWPRRIKRKVQDA